MNDPAPFDAVIVLGGGAQEALRPAPQELLRGAVRQAQGSPRIEGEDRHVDLGHDRPQQRRGLHRLQALSLQQLRQRVQLAEDLPQGILPLGHPGAEGVVALPQGRQQVREGLQGTQHRATQRPRGRQGQERRQEDPEQPGPRRRAAAEEDGGRRQEQRGKGPQKGQGLQAALVGKPHDTARPCFWSRR